MLSSIIAKIKYYLFIILFYFRNPKKYYLKKLKESDAIKIKPSQYLGNDKVSILIVTFNAFGFVKKCLESIQKTNYKNYEVIVVDNASEGNVINYLRQKELEGFIKLHLSEENNYFAPGNNIAAKLSASDSKYLLLLNSDVEIINSLWLDTLLTNAPENGIISFGKTDIPLIRPDGWCFMINKDIFYKFGGLNEYYKMNWAITELTGKILNGGYIVKSIMNPSEYIYHYGQKSHSSSTSSTKFNQMSHREVYNLFNNKEIELLKI